MKSNLVEEVRNYLVNMGSSLVLTWQTLAVFWKLNLNKINKYIL